MGALHTGYWNIRRAHATKDCGQPRHFVRVCVQVGLAVSVCVQVQGGGCL